MRILVTGGNGQLGKALQKTLEKETALFTDVEEMDITDAKKIEAIFKEFKPDWLIHGAAMTNVDGCEDNPEMAEKINAVGTKNLSEACRKHHCRMIYISTDYVFDGTKKEPYTEEDKPNPQSVYGKTKLEGEKYTLKLPDAFVLRTSWVYGDGKNFVKTMLALSEKMDEVRVVNDQFGRPTYAPDLAEAIYDVIQMKPEPGIYHVTGDGPIISWADFAKEIFKVTGKKTKVVGVSTKEYFAQYPDKRIAKRPQNSTLDIKKTNRSKIYTANWKNAFLKYLKEVEIN